MSWIERIKQDLVIITGDGKKYTPLYFNADVSSLLDFNLSKYEFEGVTGSLVARALPMGQAYDITIIFQGEDNLDVAKAFRDSSKNPKSWGINHPIYGGLKVQPISLKFDNSSLNVTTVTGSVIETILSSALIPVVDPIAAIAAKVITVAVIQNATLKKCLILPPKISFLQKLLNNIAKVMRLVSNELSLSADEFNKLANYYNKANTLVNNVIFDLEGIAAQVASLLLLPATFAAKVIDRVNMFSLQIQSFTDDANQVTTGYIDLYDQLQQKQLYSNNGGILMAGLCLAATTNITDTDYQTRIDVLEVIADIISNYNSYLNTLSALQTANGGNITSFIPDPDGLIPLDELIYYTIASLFDIANSAKQERTYVLPEDSNVIQVANLLYGLQSDDSIITALIANNNIVGFEIMQLQKGREIIYYV